MKHKETPSNPRDRELLAIEYERSVYLGGPYPSYAQLARKGKGEFTLCSIRAIAAARAEGYKEGLKHGAIKATNPK